MSKSILVGAIFGLFIWPVSGSVEAACPLGDLTQDCRVDSRDMAVLAESWLSETEAPVDLDANGEVTLGDFSILAETWKVSQIPLVINEVMASNISAVEDPQGGFDDWIEIYNAGDTAISVMGMYLTDDLDEPTKWQFQVENRTEALIGPQEYLLIWADEDDSGNWLHTNFKLDSAGDAVYLFDSDGQTLIDSFIFEAQSPDVSYGRFPDAGNTLRFFGFPTPGQPNDEGYLGKVAPLQISHERGFYDTPFDLTIACATEGAEIFYTTNGMAPDDESGRFLAGKTYTEPIRIGRTTCLRVMAVKSGWKPTPIYTNTFIFTVDEALRSLPVISLVGDERTTFYEPDGVMAIVGGSYSGGVWTSGGAGTYNNVLQRGLERPVSAEWIEPADNRGFQVDCGLRVHGSDYMRPRYVRQSGLWRGDGKFSLRLYFRNLYGQNRLDFPLFPESDIDQFRSIVLRGGHNDRTNPFIKDELLRRLHKDMGNAASTGTMANLFINGEYKGYFNPTEHIKAETCQEWFNSDLPWDVMTMSGIRDGDTRSWNEMMSYAQSHNLAIDEYYRQLGTMLDIPSFIDYLIIRLWPNDWDWPQNNWSAAAERSETGRWKFFVWDAEGTFETSQLSSIRFGELNSQGNANGILYRALKANENFRLLFADRLYKHFYNDGALAEDNIRGRFFDLRDQLAGVIGNMNSYIIDTWVPNRLSIFLNACLSEGVYTFDGPTFAVNGLYQQGGYATPGDRLFMTPPSGAPTIYYTLDGTDPSEHMAPVEQTTITLLAREAPKAVLVPTGPDVGNWMSVRGFDDSGWISSSGLPGGIGYETGRGYQEYITTDVNDQMYGINGSCYIRIPFAFSGSRDVISNMTLRMQYDDGFVAYLNGTEVARRNFDGVPAWDSLASASHDDTAAVIFEAIDLSDSIDLLRSGNNVLAIQGLNVSLTSSDFLITPELTVSVRHSGQEPADVTVYTGPISLTKSTHVKARALNGQTWSALNEAIFAVGPVAEGLRISEIMYHPADDGLSLDPNTEYIELTNIAGQSINLSFVKFTDGIEFTFPDIDLAPGDFCLVVRDLAGFEAMYGPGLPVVGQYAGSLSNGGERITFLDAAGGIIQDFRYSDDWYDITDGDGFSLTAKDFFISEALDWNLKIAWRPSAAIGGSPGFDDTGLVPDLGSIIINEVLANSAGTGPDWIELYNMTSQPIDMGGWFISDDADDLVRYEIAPGTMIPSGGYLVFYEDQHFGSVSDPGTHNPFALSRNGESLYLHSGSNGVLTGYSEQVTFGGADPGFSIGRYVTSTGQVDWVSMSETTPGQANATPAVGPIVISEIMYHPDALPDAEYIELYNVSDTEVTLYDYTTMSPWCFTNDPDKPSIEYLFPENPPITLGPGKYLILTKNRSAFSSIYAGRISAEILQWQFGTLDNDNATLMLSKPGDLDDQGHRQWIDIDRVTYSDGSHPAEPSGKIDPWPVEADGLGLSLTRTSTARYGNDPNNWQAKTPSPGLAQSRFGP